MILYWLQSKCISIRLPRTNNKRFSKILRPLLEDDGGYICICTGLEAESVLNMNKLLTCLIYSVYFDEWLRMNDKYVKTLQHQKLGNLCGCTFYAVTINGQELEIFYLVFFPESSYTFLIVFVLYMIALIDSSPELGIYSSFLSLLQKI
jgi:hypothetical protein